MEKKKAASKTNDETGITGMHLSEIADAFSPPGGEEEIVNEQEQNEIVNEEGESHITNKE